MKVKRSITTGVFLAAALTVSMSVAGAAHAGSEGRKNTAIALGAVAIHQLLNGKGTNAVLAGAATAAAYDRYKDAKDDEDRYSRSRRSDRGRSDRYDRYDRDRYDRYDRYDSRGRDNVRYRGVSDKDRDCDRYERNDRGRNDRGRYSRR